MDTKKISIIAIIMSLISICCSIYCIASLSGEKSTAEADMDKSAQYVMYVGTNDKDTYKQEISEEDAKEIVDQVCTKYFGGYTLQDATGSWTDEKNQITHEYTLVCYFDDVDKETVYKAADEVIEKLNQNTVLIEKDDLQIEYYGGKN